MATPTTTITDRVRAQARRRMPLRLGITVSATALAIGLAVAGCNRTTPTEAADSADSSTAVIPGPGDSAGVAGVAAAWDAAWNAGDAAGLAATFVDDAEFTNAGGQLFTSAEQIRAQHAITLGAQFRGSHTEGQIRRITFLSRTAALLDVDNYLTRYEPDAPGSTTMRAVKQWGRHKRLVVKRGGVWRALVFQNTMVTYVPTPQ